MFKYNTDYINNSFNIYIKRIILFIYQYIMDKYSLKE